MLEGVLPAPYEKWFAEMCGRPSPSEPRSTCESCAMLPGAPDLPPEGPFLEETRCCTYHPQLPAHFIGGILLRGSERGKEIVRARMRSRVGVTPLGIIPTPEFAESYQRIASEPGAFGRRVEVRCPFHQAGRCSIWEQRGIACASFHCKFDRGAVGAGLWNLIELAFNTIEREISRAFIQRHGLDADACDALLHAPADEALAARAWKNFYLREEEYFLAAAAFVEEISWSELLALTSSSELAQLGDLLRGAVLRAEAKPLPERVQRGQEILYRLGRPGITRMQHPSACLDPIDVPEALANRIARLGEAGEPAQIDVAKLSPDRGIDEALLRKLLDWQVLFPA